MGSPQELERPDKPKWSTSWENLPLLWGGLAWFLPDHVAERQFEPSFYDTHQDYLIRIIKIDRKKRARRLGGVFIWFIKFALNVLFAGWMLKLFIECLLGMFKKRG